LGQEHRTQEDVDEYLFLVQKHEQNRTQMPSRERGAADQYGASLN
jgi:hypothetical protein